jgi:ApaG protein
MMENLYKIEVKVKTEYIEYQSDPNRERYVFSYTVKIKNLGKIPAKLISRKWIITDANGKIEEVEGLGVIGEQPRLLTNESFEYTSGTILRTPVGSMHGNYRMIADNGYEFKAEIPIFSLNKPKILN